MRAQFEAGGLGLLLCGLLAGCRSETACQDLLRAKCLRCHGQVTTCAKMGASAPRWQETIEAMVKLGAEVSGEQGQTLVRCLSRPPGKGGNFCQ